MDELKVRLSRVAYRFGLRGVTRDYVGLEPVAPLLGRACAEGATLALEWRVPGTGDAREGAHRATFVGFGTREGASIERAAARLLDAYAFARWPRRRDARYPPLLDTDAAPWVGLDAACVAASAAHAAGAGVQLVARVDGGRLAFDGYRSTRPTAAGCRR